MRRAAKKIATTWRKWTIERKLAAVALACSVAALGGLVIAELLERPADVSNPDVTFEVREQPKAPVVRKTTNWPRYGLNQARTKYMNAPNVKPPFLRRWSYERNELIEFAPIIVDDVLYGIDNDAIFFAISAKTGKELWKRDMGSLNASSPAYSQGRLYAVNLSPPQVMSLRARDGKVIWQKPLPTRAESSPLYHNGRIYFGNEGGDFYAMRARDGKVIWKTRLAGAVKAAPAFVGGSLYVGDYAGEMYSIRAGDGRIRWRASGLGAGFGRSGRFYSTAAVAFGRVYAGNTDGRVYSFDRKTGRLAWTHSAGHFVYSGIAAADTKRTKPSVYFGSHDRNFYALDAQTGRVRWSEQPGGQVSGPATVIGNIAYISTFSGNATVGFNVKTGKRVFRLGVGQYGPVVSDGVRLYVVGGDEIRAYDPIKRVPKGVKTPPGTRGVLSPKSYRAVKRGGSGSAGAKKSGGAKKSSGAKKSGGSSQKSGSSKKRGSPKRKKRS